MLTKAADVALKPRLMISWRGLSAASAEGRQRRTTFNRNRLSCIILPPPKPKGPSTESNSPGPTPTFNRLYYVCFSSTHQVCWSPSRRFCVTFWKDQLIVFLSSSCCVPSLQAQRITVILTATLQMRTVLLRSCLVGIWTSDSPFGLAPTKCMGISWLLNDNYTFPPIIFNYKHNHIQGSTTVY